MDNLEYPEVYKEERGAMYQGRLKLTKQGVIFKNNKNGKVDQIQGGDIEVLNWLRMARGMALRILVKSGAVYRFSGFNDTDKEKLNKFFQANFEKTLVPKEMSIKGWNWGQANFEGNSLLFQVDGDLGFEVPLSSVSHCTTSKNEVTLEFHQNDDAPVQLCEMRFYIPSDPNSTVDTVQEFQKNILSKADIIQATGDALWTFRELQCLTPRGRYDIKIFQTFIQLHGKTFDYKIPLTTILRLFLLPHKDGRQIFFVLSLDPPIKQGQTRYHFLILLFSQEEEPIEVTLGLSEEEIKEKYEDKIQKHMTGCTYEIISKIMKALVQKKITVPGPFKAHHGAKCITCSFRAVQGLLYPLERGFIFVHKPPVHIRFDEIASVNFARGGTSNRSFDFEIEVKNGTVHTFSSIDKVEYDKLFDFANQKNLRIKNSSKAKESATYNEDLVDSDVEEGEPDAYLERMKKEGQERVEAGGGSDSDDESDESFNPDQEGGGSDVAEEYDSNPPTSSSSEDDEEEGSVKKEKIKKEKRSGSEASSGASDDDEEEEKPKKKPKEPKKSKSAKTVKEPGMGKKPRKKKVKDKNKPKRPPSAYFLYLSDVREQIKKENPGISITEITKKAGEMWKNVEDKSKWEEEARQKKIEYAKAMAEYESIKKEKGGSEGEDEEKEDKKAKKKTPSKPRTSPKKKAAGDGESEHYKSKEYISTESSSSADEDDKPLKTPKVEVKEEPMDASSAKSSSDKDMASDED